MTAANPFGIETGPSTQANDDATVMPPCKSARPSLAVIRIAGDDAADFLHGQFSAELRALEVGHGVSTAWCSPKGRVLFLPRVLRGGATLYYALLPSAQSAAFIKRLRMFVLRAKVVVEDCSSSHGVLVLDGATPPSLPADVLAVADGDRHWLLGARSALAPLWDALTVPAQSTEGARQLDIARGEVTLDATLSDEFLPQELNLDVVNGVSFNKGCYPGQEIVARVRFRGTVKRRLQRLAIATAEIPAPGTRLIDASAAAHGTVLCSAARNAADSEVLAVVDVDVQISALHLATNPDAAITPLTLPYALPGA